MESSDPKGAVKRTRKPAPCADKPCYYHYHYHYRSDRPLDESHILINNMTLLKLRKVTFRIFVSCHFIN